MQSLPRARRFDWNNLALRIVSAAVLAPAALAMVWVDGALARPFLVLVAVAVSLLSIEWSLMIAPRAPARVAAVVMVTVLTVVFLTYARQVWPALGVIAFGALAAAAVSRGLTPRAVDAAYGVLYIAPACLAMVWLRGSPEGARWTVMLLATTWAADIAAYAVGNALKGPKLWPRLSPKKTWSGFFGGLIGAALTAIAIVNWRLMYLSLAGAAFIGLACGLATMMGDLWESMLKRRFGVKDSGDLIPGHGGLLDRVDGLMFATIVFAAARLIVRFGWAH
ncbi:MAG TPA: phosphatidate cytidylyltransferase [Caulobacteraceae bacterium]|nr:phosphatidate cytidylyltransferase [Caulobacteraceae bacterium]